MRVHSTPKSALEGEVTILASVECFLSIAIYIWIGFYRHTFAHYAWAIAVAPLMLFRTDLSSLWALNVMSRITDFFKALGGWGAVPALFLFPLIAVALRIAATVYWLFRQPISTISEMPANWIRQTLCTDLSHPPEMLPLEATKGDFRKVPTAAEFAQLLRNEPRAARRIVTVVILLPILVGWLPPLFYRISFKPHLWSTPPSSG